MSEPLNHTTFGDAPLTAAKHAAAGAVSGIGAEELGDYVGRSVTIARPRAELFALWRDFSKLPRFMPDARQADLIDPRRARWYLGADDDDHAIWETQITAEMPNEFIEWRTFCGDSRLHEGRVAFSEAAGGRGTVVTATLVYHQAGGSLGKWWARLFHDDPRLQVRRELRRFKQFVETGELATASPPYAAPRAE